MKCPFCGSTETQVIESRSGGESSSVRRRRECERCEKRFTTHERVDRSVLWVTKKGGRREPFDREKIKRGVLRAIEKRPVSIEIVDELIDRVEREMMRKQKPEIRSRAIGSSVMRKLKRIDEVAWLRFASVYLEFEDIDDFLKAVKK